MNTTLHARLCPTNHHTTERHHTRLILQSLDAEISHHPEVDEGVVAKIEVRKDDGSGIKGVGFALLTIDEVRPCKDNLGLSRLIDQKVAAADEKAGEAIVRLLKRREEKA